jgi:hypothetical protein
MVKNYLSKLQSLSIYIIFFLLSLTPFIWGYDIQQYQLIGGGDFISLMNIENIISERFFVYNLFSSGGMDYSFISAHLFPFYIFYLVFSYLNFTPLATTLLFISAIILISEISMYFWIKYIFEKKIKLTDKKVKLWAFFGGVLYGFSPFIAALIHPGHMLLLLAYAFFPLLLLHYDLLLNEENINPKRLLILFIILLFHASAFANVGIIYSLIIVLLFYTLCVYIIYSKDFSKFFIRFCLILFLIIASNGWWIIPFLSTINEAISINQASNTITSSIGQSTEKASIVNIFLSKAEYLFYADARFGKYTGVLLTSLFSALAIPFSFTLLHIKKYKYLLVLLSILILGITITKGDRAPFQEIFLWMYDFIPGFQVFRRPVSKFYWVFYFSYVTLSLVGIIFFEQKIKKGLKYISVATGIYFTALSSNLIFNFATTPPMRVFNIPPYYASAGNYLLTENVNKVLVLPGIFGQQPIYNESVDRYGGIDFLDYIWRFSLASPDQTNYSLELPHKKPVNNLMSLIDSNKSICQAAKNIGITHIMVRQDLWTKQPKQDKPEMLLSILDEHPDVAAKKKYGASIYKGFTIYSLRDDCLSGIVKLESNKDAKISYLFKNPTKIEILIQNLSTPSELLFLNNFSKSWKIYEGGPVSGSKSFNNKNYFNSISNHIAVNELYFLFKKPLFEDSHREVHSFANSWTLDPSQIEAANILHEKNADNSINIHLVLLYKPQLYLYMGMALTITTFLYLLGRTFFDYNKLRGKDE